MKHLYLTLLLSLFVFVACGILSLVFLLGIAFCRRSWPSPEVVDPERLDLDVPKAELKEEPYLEVSVPKQFLLRAVPRMSQIFPNVSSSSTSIEKWIQRSIMHCHMMSYVGYGPLPVTVGNGGL